MDEQERLCAERLVQVHKARSEVEGDLILGYLHDNGIEATLIRPPTDPLLHDLERLFRNRIMLGIFVLEHEGARARRLVREFISVRADEMALEELAAQKPRLTKEHFAQLRAALREERHTFQFLGWLGLAFCAALLLWLRVPLAGFHWLVLIMLIMAALVAGSWLRKKL